MPGFSLASRLHAGEVVHSAWCGLGSPIVAEMIARDGFAAVTLDAQHGLWDFATMASAVMAIRDAGAAPMVRVALNDLGTYAFVAEPSRALHPRPSRAPRDEP